LQSLSTGINLPSKYAKEGLVGVRFFAPLMKVLTPLKGVLKRAPLKGVLKRAPLKGVLKRAPLKGY
jgi:hypothetical protein